MGKFTKSSTHACDFWSLLLIATYPIGIALVLASDLLIYKLGRQLKEYGFLLHARGWNYILDT